MCDKLQRSAVLGVGASVPKKVVTNADLEKVLDTSDSWIRERTGIQERRVAEEGEVTSEYCLRAANMALERAGISPDELGLIIVGTATPDYPFPSTAAMLQRHWGINGQMAFDVTAACSGFLYGLTVADQFIKNDWCKYALVVGGELLSRITNWDDRSTAVLFGDGAGAVVLGKSEEPEKRGILSTVANADGNLYKILYMPGGGSKHPSSYETVDKSMHTIHMEGSEVFKVAVRSLIEAAEKALELGGVKAEDVDLFIPHQANLRIIDAVGKRVGVDDDKIYKNVHHYGNTSSASIPIALNEAYEAGLVKPGDLVLLDAFGGGVTCAAVALRW